MWPVPHEMDCNGLGWAALAADLGNGIWICFLESPVWGLFLFLFRQHRRQHCYCLLMHYFALFSCGRQQQQVAAAAQADGFARAWQWATVQHTNLFFFAVCGELKIHKFPTSQMCCTHAKGRGQGASEAGSCYTLCATPKCMDNEQRGRGAGHANCWQSGIQLARRRW